MPEKERGVSDKIRGQMTRKIRLRAINSKAKTIKVRYIAAILAIIGTAVMPQKIVQAAGCPDLRIVFARGSGADMEDANYQDFKSTIESKLSTTDLKYEFINLDYPAVGVGIDNIGVTLGAFFGAGDTYEFGESVKTGTKKLTTMVNSASCPGTQYVLGGYSQGAMVVSRSLGSLNANRVIYAATFGDPKIYLPEGAGIIPAACRGDNLSDYRMYVPDCQAYKGLLGAYIPYEPDAFAGKLGTWCNKRDIFCSSHLSVSDHVGYVSDNLYEDASRVIFDKITKYFGIENNITSPHDTAILIDSTGSMQPMIDKYKAEALRLAKETLDSGGRVALYDYRDLRDPYTPVKHCDFDTCTLEVFQNELDKITADNGGDTPESLLSASLHVMQELNWKYGSTKSLVVLTDANFLSPDRDGVTFDQVVALSKSIDPVNFYIITKADFEKYYIELAGATDGKIVTRFNELSLLTDYIMERYDSLPRVEEGEPVPRPTLAITNTEQTGDAEMKVQFTTDGTRTMVILNDTILGITDGTEITIGGLSGSNVLSLVPLGDDIRGEAVEVKLNVGGYGREDDITDAAIDDESSVIVVTNTTIALPKAPNTGRR